MTIEKTRLPIRLRRWKEGDPPSARHLNEPVEAIRRLIEGVNPPGIIRRRRPEDQLEARRFEVVSEGRDFLWCKRKGGSTSSAATDGLVRVAKPPLLRRTPYDGTEEGRNGVTYEYSAHNERTATITDSGQTEDQAIVPSYQEGDEIVALRGVLGGTGVRDENADVAVHWIDQNLDGRQWGQT